MRRIRRVLGAVLATLAAALVVAQLLSLLVNGSYLPVSSAALWQAVDADSLAHFRALVASNFPGPARAPVGWLLDLPAWLVAGLAALPLLLAGRRGRRGFD